MFNLNTNKTIDVEVPIKDGQFNNEGTCSIAGVDGTAGELKVNFLDPAGAKTGKLFPTGNARETLDLGELGTIEATILDVSNPMVLVRAADLGITGTQLPAEVDTDKALAAKLEAIRGAACVRMGFAKDPADATANSPAVPKVGFVTAPASFTDISGKSVDASEMDVCARVISVFKCHKACPLTSASSISVAAFVPGTLVHELVALKPGQQTVRIGHPSGVMTMYPYLDDPTKPLNNIVVLRRGCPAHRTPHHGRHPVHPQVSGLKLPLIISYIFFSFSSCAKRLENFSGPLLLLGIHQLLE